MTDARASTIADPGGAGVSRLARPLGGVIAALAWFALVVQYAIVLDDAIDRGRSLLTTSVRYFGFFTILTNLLIAVGLTARVLAPRSRAGVFFARPATTAATALYITIVAAVYTLVLRRLWDPGGWQKLADVLLHDVVPAAYLGYWALLLPKGRLPWSASVKWLGFPAAYFIYTVVRGRWMGGYPYPFLDVATLGYTRVLLNAGVLLLVFVLLGLAFVALDRLLWRRQTQRVAGARVLS